VVQPRNHERRHRAWPLALTGAALALLHPCVRAAVAQAVPVAATLQRLETSEDTDGDRRISVRDRTSPFELRAADGTLIDTVGDVYRLSVLLQELKRAADERRSEVALSALGLDESVVDRTHRLIRQRYWDALTRRVDGDNVDLVVHDAKVTQHSDTIYVPALDAAAVRYFRGVESAARERGRVPELRVVALPAPEKITAGMVRALDGQHGILSLALERDAAGNPVRGVPYVVPGGRFNELYYWDSYFIVLGLLHDGRTDLARGMADNLLYEMEHYGKVPNANRSYYLTRSQPPFLTSIVRAVYEAGAADRTWLSAAIATAVAEYRDVWTAPDRSVAVGEHRLSRYFGGGRGPCPEVEAGHYDEKVAPWLAAVPEQEGAPPLTPFVFLNRYLYCGEYAGLSAGGMTLDEFFTNDRAVRESGHDTTHRFDDRTTEFAPVALNSLLYRYEEDLADLLDHEFGGVLPGLGPGYATAASWRRRAAARERAIVELMWDGERGFFFDYDLAHRRRSTYVSATGLYPLWAGVLDPGVPRDREMAARAAACMRAELEQPAGLAASAASSVAAARRHDRRQWDYPFGWAPHQMLAWRGLARCGLAADAERLAYRWLLTIARNARDYNGTIPEKIDVVTGSHEVFVEYGNVGTAFDYITPEGFGWMNASFQVGVDYLTPRRLADLEALRPWSAMPPAETGTQ
jgi:alpha,alpha-trehalase